MKKIKSTLLLDDRPISAISLGHPADGEMIKVGHAGVTAIMPYEEPGEIWFAVVTKRGALVGGGEHVEARVSMRYVGMVHYRDVSIPGRDDNVD